MRIGSHVIGSGFLLLFAGTLAQAAPPLTDAVLPLRPEITVRTIRESTRNTLCVMPAGAFYLECTGPDSDSGGMWFGYDAAGSFYEITYGVTAVPPDGDHYLSLQRIASDGSEEVLAYLLQRQCSQNPCTSGGVNTFRYWIGGAARFDVTNGLLRLVIESFSCGSQGCDEGRLGIVEIGGLPKMFDTLLTFLPGSTLAAMTPGLPDGFRSADSMQIWTGDVHSMPDWSQAQPLACMAATSPAPGQIVTVPDTLPDPPLGHGRYYLTASVSGTDRRLGRQYVNGAFSARNPTGLPMCTP